MTSQAEPTPLQTFWSRYFRVYDTLLEAIPYREMLDRHAELLEAGPGDKILDAGAGTGNNTKVLREAGAEVVGVDFSEEALEICRRKMPDGDFRFADLTKRLEFDDDDFDKIACCNVIYTLAPDDQKRAVAELYRVLRGGGTAAITVFGDSFRALGVYSESVRRYLEDHSVINSVLFALRYSVNTVRILYYVGRIKRRRDTGAYTFYSQQAFRELLEEGGFVVEHLEPTFASQCLIALARKPASGSA